MVHGRQVRAAVHSPKVGCGTGVTLTVSGRLSIGHWVGSLHAGGGGRQWVWQRRDGGRAPNGHRRSGGGDGRDRSAGGRGELAARPALRTGFPRWRALLFGRSHLVLASVLLLLLLLATLCPSVFKPNLTWVKTELITFTVTSPIAKPTRTTKALLSIHKYVCT